MTRQTKLLPTRAAPLLLAGVFCACTPPVDPAPGCRPWSYQDSSTDPPGHCLFFPTGLAVDPLGDVLYVSNSNADLSFGGGTLVAIDLGRYERAVACAHNPSDGLPSQPFCGAVSCADSGVAQLGPTALVESILQYETQKTQGHPEYFDRCYCERDLLDPTLINCDSDRFVLRDQTIKTGNFAGQIYVQAEDPADWNQASTLTRSIYMPVRGDPSITYVQVQRSLPQGVSRPQVKMRCGQEPVPGDNLVSCADAFRVQQSPDNVSVDLNDPTQGIQPRFLEPPEPFGLALDQGCLQPGFTHRRGDPPGVCYSADRSTMCPAQGKCGDISYHYLVATHLSGADVSAYDLDGDPPHPGLPVLTDVRGDLYVADANMRRGAFAVAPRKSGDLSEPWYVTARLSPKINTFRLSPLPMGVPDPLTHAAPSPPSIVPGPAVTLANDFPGGGGSDVRDLYFTPDGSRAFLTVASPPTLVALDTRNDPLESGAVPLDQVITTVDLCAGPSRLAVAQVPRSGAAGAPQQVTQVYTACFSDGQVAVVDADAGLLLAKIQVGRGPYNIALNFGGPSSGSGSSGTGIDPCADPYVSDQAAAQRQVICRPDEGLRLRPFGPAGGQLPPRAYVATYLDNAIAVIDLDPRSMTYQHVISRIGKPMPKQAM